MNAEKFEKCVQFVFDREGRVFENDANDPGGGTKFGISSKAYPNIAIKELNEEQAKALYLRDYWNKMNCDQYEAPIALAVFDTAVNQGCGMAMTILEELKADGKTLTQSAYLFKRLRHYSNLIQKKPNLERYCHNWMLRVVKVWEAKL
jgi:lysozyme family protein